MVGVLSQVSHKGLHHDCKQTSVYLQIINSTNHYTTSLFFSKHNYNSIHNSERNPRKTITHILEPIYIPRALSTGTCIQQGDVFYSAGLHRNWCSPQLNTGKTRKRFGKNAGEWTGRLEISKEEFPGNKCSMYGYILTCSKL